MTKVDRARIVAALDEEWDTLLALGDGLSDDEWGLPTACPGWSVRDNLSHCLGTEAMLLGRSNPDIDLPDDLPHVRNDLGRINEVWVESYRSRPPAELMDDFRAVVAERRAALAAMDDAEFEAESWTPAGRDTYGRFMRIRVMDQWMHEQDMREAVGRPGHLEGLAPEAALDEVVGLLGYVVGKRAAAPAGSSVRFELTGPMSRRVDVDVSDRARVVDALAGEPGATITLPGARLMRLVGGRVQDHRERADGVQVGGDQTLAQQVLDNLAVMI
ncbi:MAG TPA: maleylpyruvate isomerase family mycothiol-dependent enzyme [Acidimicrobiales bacterium]